MADQPSAISGALRQPFREQVAFFRGKLGNLVPTQRWDDITAGEHDTAFMVAGAQKAELLQDLATAVDRAIAQGTSLDTFRKDFGAAVERHDWHGWTGEDTKGGRAWRTRTIYRTNASTSYSAGRRAQLEAGKFKYWIYRHGGSKEPRLEHLDLDGIALPPDHPFWDKFFPPSDWGCSCYVVGARTRAGIKRLGGDPDKVLPGGWDRVDPRTGEPAGIGKGWGYAPGARVAQSINDKLRALDGPIAQAFLDSLPEALRLRITGRSAADGSPEIPAITSVDQLTAEERRILSDYTGSAYRAINEALRLEGRLTADGEIISDVLERSRLPTTTKAYRGIHGVAAQLVRSSELEPGDVIRDAAFASMSLDSAISADFKGGGDGVGDGVLFIIRLPAGAKALDVEPISSFRKEKELLLQRGIAMKVIRWDAEAGVLEVEVVNDG